MGQPYRQGEQKQINDIVAAVPSAAHSVVLNDVGRSFGVGSLGR
jgi:hypothetical protein